MTRIVDARHSDVEPDQGEVRVRCSRGFPRFASAFVYHFILSAPSSSSLLFSLQGGMI